MLSLRTETADVGVHEKGAWDGEAQQRWCIGTYLCSDLLSTKCKLGWNSKPTGLEEVRSQRWSGEKPRPLSLQGYSPAHAGDPKVFPDQTPPEGSGSGLGLFPTMTCLENIQKEASWSDDQDAHIPELLHLLSFVFKTLPPHPPCLFLTVVFLNIIFFFDV